MVWALIGPKADFVSLSQDLQKYFGKVKIVFDRQKCVLSEIVIKSM